MFPDESELGAFNHSYRGVYTQMLCKQFKPNFA